MNQGYTTDGLRGAYDRPRKPPKKYKTNNKIICPECGVEFISHYKNKITCSIECSYKRHVRTCNDWAKRKREENK